MNTYIRTSALAAILVLPHAMAQQGPAISDEIEYKSPVSGTSVRRNDIKMRGIAERPTVSAIAPDHVGRTASEQPTLYWFISRRSAVRVEIALVNAQSGKAKVTSSIANVEPGIHRFSLSEHNVRIEPGEEYLWSVSLVWDDQRRSQDVVSQGALVRIDPSAELKARLAGLAKTAQARAFAADGIWYDAIAALSESIEEQPGSRELRAQRASLLDQAGLREAAAYDRRTR